MSQASGGWLRRGLWAALFVGLGGLPRTALADTCVQIDEQKDGLDAEERTSVRTLFEEALGEEHVTVVREGCTETWTLYHVRLGESLTVVVVSPRGTRRERVNKIEDLPGIYSQMVRSLLTGAAQTNDSSAIDRRNVTASQNTPERIRADAIWYAKLGFGATSADNVHAGPAFGFGRRWELDRIGIDLGFFNFLLYQNSNGFSGTSASWVELAVDYYFDAYANSSLYFGGGLSLGSHTIPHSGGGDYTGSGLQGRATLGYEMFRASTIRLLVQLDSTLPMFRLLRKDVDPTTLLDIRDHTYSPNLTLSLGLGWGGAHPE